MEQRKEFLEAAMRKEHSFTELCRRFGISRKNGYKWLNRYRDELAFPNGAMSYADRSRRPRRSPTAISAEVETAIVDLRKQRPHWGPKKLRVVLGKQCPELALPSESTFAAVLKRHGLVRPRRKRTKSPPYTAPLGHATHPNAVWSIDFKGDFAIGRTRCYPLTVTDSYSRFIIACIALTNTKAVAVKRALQRIFDEYGLPEAIRTDNGSPFSSRGVAGLSTLSVWWHKLGIRHERIDPGHPEQNGRHERMHRDLKHETALPPATSLAAQQRRFDQFRARFNQERPHEALEQRTPHEFYDVSSRPLPTPHWGKDFEYDMEAEALRVSKDGAIATHRGAFFLSTTLAHELVEIDWYENNRARVMFGTMKLGELVAKAKRRQLRFFPVENVGISQPITIAADQLSKSSPMSSDNVPF
jgi:transposase InsO family protein